MSRDLVNFIDLDDLEHRIVFLFMRVVRAAKVAGGSSEVDVQVTLSQTATLDADVPPGVIEVLEGFSTAVTLPEKADLLVAEIVGSIASEEGLHATMRDAQARHVKRPYDPASYIPNRCQTVAAPATYALHYALGPPQFDWGKLKGEPVRRLPQSCRAR